VTLLGRATAAAAAVSDADERL